MLPKRLFLHLMFWNRQGYRLHLNTPRTYSEKLQWLKLHDIHPEYSKLVDKISVKEHVASIIGREHVIPTLHVYNGVEDIPFEDLPRQFVIKCSHDSGGVLICKDKPTLDIEKAKDFLVKKLARKYINENKEYPYEGIVPRLLVEPYLEDESGYELRDYKFFCFNGIPRLIQMDFNRHTHHERALFDLDWNRLDLEIRYPSYRGEIVRPKALKEMIEIATALSKGFRHIRVDLYHIKGVVYFGELTFFHGSGFERFRPREWDFKMGEWLVLPPTTCDSKQALNRCNKE